MIMPKRSSITCLSDHVDLSNHRARIALAEKGVSAEVEYVDLANPTEDFLSLNPYHTLPVLIDRDLVLNQSNFLGAFILGIPEAESLPGQKLFLGDVGSTSS